MFLLPFLQTDGKLVYEGEFLANENSRWKQFSFLFAHLLQVGFTTVTLFCLGSSYLPLSQELRRPQHHFSNEQPTYSFTCNKWTGKSTSPVWISQCGPHDCFSPVKSIVILLSVFHSFFKLLTSVIEELGIGKKRCSHRNLISILFLNLSESFLTWNFKIITSLPSHLLSFYLL